MVADWISASPAGSHGRAHGRTLPQTVLVFLVLITSGLQYLVQRMNYNRDLKRIEWIVGQARQAAWGAKLNPIEGQRKVSTWSSGLGLGSHIRARYGGHGDSDLRNLTGQGEPGGLPEARRRRERGPWADGGHGGGGERCVHRE